MGLLLPKSYTKNRIPFIVLFFLTAICSFFIPPHAAVIADDTRPIRWTYVFMNGTEKVSEQTIYQNGTVKKLTRPAAPSAREGHAFTGWKIGNTTVDFDKEIIIPAGAVDQTILVEAQFDLMYSIYFCKHDQEPCGEGEYLLNSKHGVSGDTITVSDMLVTLDDGSSVVGWKLNNEQVASVTIGNSDITLFPIIVGRHVVSFVTNGGTSVAAQRVEHGSFVQKPADPVKGRDVFLGWYTDRNCTDGNEYDFAAPVSGSIPLYAKWKGVTIYKIQYMQEKRNENDYDIAKTIDKIEAIIGSFPDMPAIDSKLYASDGFHLNGEGWFDGNLIMKDDPLLPVEVCDSDGCQSYATGQKIDRPVAADGSTTINIYYSRNEYRIQFKFRNGDNAIEATRPILTIKYRQYMYDAWWEESEKIRELNEGSYRICPDWRNKYSCQETYFGPQNRFNWFPNNGNFLKQFSDGELITAWVDSVEKYQYTFYTYTEKSDQPLEGNQKYCADYPAECKGQTLLIVDGRNSLDGKSHVFDRFEKVSRSYATGHVHSYTSYPSSNYILVENFRDRSSLGSNTHNYSFRWNYDTQAYEPLYLYAILNRYELNFYDTFAENNPNIGKYSNLISGEDISGKTPTEPNYTTTIKTKREAGRERKYKFEDWYENEYFTGEPYELSVMPSKNLHLYAKWVHADAAVYFNLEGGTYNGNDRIDTQIVDIGNRAAEPEGKLNKTDSSGHEYRFAYWEDVHGERYDFSTPVMEDINLFAVWEIIPPTVRVQYDPGERGEFTLEDPESYYLNTKAITIGEPTLKEPKSYYFIGWQVANSKVQVRNGGQFVIKPADVVDNVVTLHAVYESTDNKTVRYHSNYPDGICVHFDVTLKNNPQSHTVLGNGEPDGPDFSFASFVFTGWNTQADGRGDAYKKGDNLAMYDVYHRDLYAQWEQSIYPEIRVKKVWEDNRDELQLRPTSISITLYQNGIPYPNGTLTLSEPTWEGKFTDLPKYDANGNEYEYSVTENFSSQSHYKTEIEPGTSGYNKIFTIVNYLNRMEVAVQKQWIDNGDPNRPLSIQIQLYQTVNGVTSKYNGVISLSERNGWHHTFHDLPKTDAQGNPITYSVVEDFVRKSEYAEEYIVTSTPNKTTITIQNTKAITGSFPLVWKTIESPDADTLHDIYTFRLIGGIDTPMPTDAEGNVVDTITISAKDPMPRRKGFGDIHFQNDGTYIYTIREVTEGAVYTATPEFYNVIFTVSNGRITSREVYRGDTDELYTNQYLIFQNSYPGSDQWATPYVRKEITGIKPEKAETYTFRLKRYTVDAPMPEGSVNGEKFITITGEGTAQFGPVSFTCNKTTDCVYEYRIREVIPTGSDKTPGEVYDDTEYHVFITVDHSTGAVSKRVEINGIEVDYPDNTYMFTNHFPEGLTTTNMKVRKVVRDGTPEPGDKFYFLLEAVSKPDTVEAYPMPVLSNDDGKTKLININGDDIVNDVSEEFGIITFPAAGKYTYTIRELGEADLDPDQYLDNYEYDDNFFTVTFDVYADESGINIAETHVTNASGSTIHPETIDAFTFRNRMLPEGAADDLRVEKIIIPAGAETENPADFRFTLTLNEKPKDIPESENPMPEETLNQTMRCIYEGGNHNILSCALTGGSLNFYLGLIRFPMDGIYKYTVVEETGQDPDFDYDNAVYQITYTVEGDEVTRRTITKDGKDYTGKKLVFTNTYHKPASTTGEITVRKVILEGEPLPEDIFHFTMTPKNSDYPMPAGSSGSSKTIAIHSSDMPMEASFGEITFEDIGEYVYEVREVQNELEHFTYDPTVYTVIFRVSKTTDEGTSKLTAQMLIELNGYREDERDGKKLVFENVYVEPNEATLLANKFVSGGTPLIRDYFRIVVIGKETTAEGLDFSPLPEKCEDNKCTYDILGTGRAFFGKVAFDLDGEYNYEVYEEPGESEDYVYDDSVYRVKLTVRDGKVDRNLEITKDGDELTDLSRRVSFENHYLKGVDDKHPTVRKLIKGKPNRDEVFTFTLAVDPLSPWNPMPAGAKDGIVKLEINGEGQETFGTLSFDEPGRYVYTIREIPGETEDFHYDSTIYTVTYDVSRSEGGTTIERTVKKGGVDYEGSVYLFTNIWGDGSDEGGEGDGGGSSDVLPKTGFAPGVITKLPKQRVDYSVYSQVRVKIPALGINAEVLGVPKSDGDWDVSWLGDNVGWLQGTAWPASSKAGNAVLTGHSYNYLGKPGVFANLDRLGYGAMITVSAYGENYTYMVEDVETVFADTPRVMSQKTDAPELTLITCKYFNESTGQYDGRIVVKAKLVEIN